MEYRTNRIVKNRTKPFSCMIVVIYSLPAALRLFAAEAFMSFFKRDHLRWSYGDQGAAKIGFSSRKIRPILPFFGLLVMGSAYI